MTATGDPKDIHFERLYNGNKDVLYRFLLRMTGNTASAQDLLQDSFLNFFRYFEEKQLPDDLGCRRFLFRIARNLAINFSQEAYNRRVSLGSEPDSMLADSIGSRSNRSHDTVLDVMHRESANEVLEEILETLEEKERTALILRHTADMNLQDIASILNISAATVSRLLKRLSIRLLQEMKRKGYDHL